MNEKILLLKLIDEELKNRNLMDRPKFYLPKKSIEENSHEIKLPAEQSIQCPNCALYFKSVSEIQTCPHCGYLINGNIIEKSIKLTKDEYKELLKEKNYSNIPLSDKYYKSPKSGIFWAQMHIRGVLPEEYEDYKSDNIPLWKAIHKHSMHVDLRCSFTGLKRLFQLVLVEDSIDSYLRVMKGSVDPKTNQVSKGLIVIKPSAMEPSERLKEKKEMLLDEAGAKKVADLIIDSKSYWINPGGIGATSETYAYMGAIVLGRVESGTMRDDFKELFLHPRGENSELWNGRFIVKAFESPRHLWWTFKAIKTPTPCNPYCEIDSGNFKLLPADRLKYFKKEDYKEYQTRKEEC